MKKAKKIFIKTVSKPSVTKIKFQARIMKNSNTDFYLTIICRLLEILYSKITIDDDKKNAIKAFLEKFCNKKGAVPEHMLRPAWVKYIGIFIRYLEGKYLKDSELKILEAELNIKIIKNDFPSNSTNAIKR